MDRKVWSVPKLANENGWDWDAQRDLVAGTAQHSRLLSLAQRVGSLKAIYDIPIHGGIIRGIDSVLISVQIWTVLCMYRLAEHVHTLYLHT